MENEIIKKVKSINIEVETNTSDSRIIKFCSFFENQDIRLETDNDKIVLTITKLDKDDSITLVKNTREEVDFMHLKSKLTQKKR